jgi:putative membrane-bound dehydrogenase-like protein
MKPLPILLFTFITSLVAREAPEPGVFFKRIQLSDQYLTEGASIGDLNADGKPDVVAGPLWWQGPDFKKSHAYEPVKVFPITGYSQNFFTFPDLITKDKWTDILKVGLPAQPAHLAINPGEKPLPADNKEHQCEHCPAQEHICNESPQYVNVLGKSRQLLAHSRGYITLSEPAPDPTKPWIVHRITPKDSGVQMFIHGLGSGDIDGDKLPDILEKRGWWQQPKNWDRKTPWKFHPFAFAPKQGGAQMFSYDIDGDGDADVVTALNAHSWGMAWYEQIQKDGAITFKQHIVMTDKPAGNPYGVCFSQPHAMDCVDIDGDGIKDIVTGKCYFAHNGRDPGAHDPAVLYWFRTTRHKDGTTELIPYLIDDNSGVGRQISTGDLNGDGKPDIVVGNKKGVFAFIQTETPPETKPVSIPKTGQLLEGESLQITKSTGSVGPQDLRSFGDVWSNHSHVWWTKGKPNDLIEFTFRVPAEANYRLGVGLTKAADYGIVEFYLDDQKISSSVDLYHNGVVHSGTIPLGEVHPLKAGLHRLGVKMLGSNPNAIKSYMFALDYLVLHPGSKEDLLKVRHTPAHKPKNAKPARKASDKPLKGGNDINAEVRSPTEQLASFTLPPGFIIELVSSEEQGTVKPISIAFDDAGRLWTQTARAYPLDKDAAAFTKKGPDQILVFDHPHFKGPLTPRIFADHLSMPVSVLPHDREVLAIHGPNLISLEDTDGDGKADRRKILASGFGIQDTHTTVHQLTRTPGGWINFSQGCICFGTVTTADGNETPFNRSLIARIRPNGTRLEIIGAGMNNIWCWATNSEGQTFIHEANDFGYSHAPFERDATYPSFVNTLRYPDSFYHPPTAQDLELGGTGFSGIAISEDTTRGFPTPWQNVHFVANPITGSINTVSYSIDKNGVYQFKKEQDLVTCSDPMFRPIALEFGADGCLYLIDWYNRIISHNEVRNDHPSRDKISGRIWRIRHESQSHSPPPNLEKSPDSQLLKHLASTNLWERRAAWHQVAKRQVQNLIPELMTIIRNPKSSDSFRIHALWCLESLGHFDQTLWRELITSRNPNVRYETLRTLSTLQPPLAKTHQLLTPFANDPSFRVRNELARFYRDTPHNLEKKHSDFLTSLRTSEARLSKKQVKGWKGSYLALGGPYETAFLNLLVDKALNRDAPPSPLVDETRWNKFIATHPKKSPAAQKQVQDRINSLTKSITTSSPGDIAKGTAHFNARCATCHAAEGSSGFAPALGGGQGRSVEALLTAILDPNAAAEGVFNTYQVIKKDGSKIEGFRSNLTADNLTLTFMGGGTLDIPLVEIKEAGYIQGKSIMPDSITTEMSDQDYLDLISYLRSIK